MQIALTFIATFCIYMIFALLDNDFGFDGLFGLVIFQPFFAIILSSLTIFCCLIIGLPIRLNKKVNYWWTTKFYIAIIGTLCGLTMLILAILPQFQETLKIYISEDETSKQIPNSTLSYVGWFLTAFSILHTYPPRQLTEKIKSHFKKVFKVSLVFLTLLTITSCSLTRKADISKPTILKAYREAPLGYVNLIIFQDSTFEFVLSGIRSKDKTIYPGKVKIANDTLFFAYSDSIPKAGKIAIYNDWFVSYIDGNYQQTLQIGQSYLKTK
jgi:hypothetical protein